MELPKGKIALVTGGSRGTACALMLVERGANVANGGSRPRRPLHCDDVASRLAQYQATLKDL
jgi:NAD(P)-dependent dehydrogenase (short-subunit alcohol dehydrogenase family)